VDTITGQLLALAMVQTECSKQQQPRPTQFVQSYTPAATVVQLVLVPSILFWQLIYEKKKKIKIKIKKKRSFTSTKRMTPIQSTVDVLRINLNDLLVSIL